MLFFGIRPNPVDKVLCSQSLLIFNFKTKIGVFFSMSVCFIYLFIPFFSSFNSFYFLLLRFRLSFICYFSFYFPILYSLFDVLSFIFLASLLSIRVSYFLSVFLYFFSRNSYVLSYSFLLSFCNLLFSILTALSSSHFSCVPVRPFGFYPTSSLPSQTCLTAFFLNSCHVFSSAIWATLLALS